MKLFAPGLDKRRPVGDHAIHTVGGHIRGLDLQGVRQVVVGVFVVHVHQVEHGKDGRRVLQFERQHLDGELQGRGGHVVAAELDAPRVRARRLAGGDVHGQPVLGRPVGGENDPLPFFQIHRADRVGLLRRVHRKRHVTHDAKVDVAGGDLVGSLADGRDRRTKALDLPQGPHANRRRLVLPGRRRQGHRSIQLLRQRGGLRQHLVAVIVDEGKIATLPVRLGHRWHDGVDRAGDTQAIALTIVRPPLGDIHIGPLTGAVDTQDRKSPRPGRLLGPRSRHDR